MRGKLNRRVQVLAIVAVAAFGLFESLAVTGIEARDTDANSDTRATIDKAELSINATTGERMHAGQPFTGVALRYFSNGQRESEESFLHGRRNGSLRRWFDNGQLAFESSYMSGRREGITTSWWGNGNLRSQTTYVDDRTHGIAWSWYRGGEKFKRYSFAAGQPVGLQQAWRLNGKLFSNFEYRNGRTYGLRNSNLCVDLDDETINVDG